MSTAGKYGERQSWRRSGRGEAGNRRTQKVVWTVLAAALIVGLLAVVLWPQRRPRLRTILVSNAEYDLDVVTPPMFAATAEKRLKEQLDIETTLSVASTDDVRNTFQQTELLSDVLQDPDDTVMVIVRGYLMLDANQQPAIACSDLAIPESDSETQGLLPLRDILQPLTESPHSDFKGHRVVVLDVEPLAAHPLLGQWNDDAYRFLDSTLKELDGTFAERLWVLTTRGPLQNAGWDEANHLPISTQTFLDAFGGQADLDSSGDIKLEELCAFMSARYDQLPYRAELAPPQLMLFQGRRGRVPAEAAARGELDVWLSYVDPESNEPAPAADADEADADEADADEATESESSGHNAVASATRPATRLSVTPVARQLSESSTDDAASSNAVDSGATTRPGSNQPAAPSSDANSETGSDASSDTSTAQPDLPATTGSTPTATTAAGETAQSPDQKTQAVANQFWALRDRFEDPRMTLDDPTSLNSPVALAPHLWRRLIVKLLGTQIEAYDPNHRRTSTDALALFRDDLVELEKAIAGQPHRTAIDETVQRLQNLVVVHQRERAGQRTDERLRNADRLQHTIAVARCRIWSWLEHQRQASLNGGQLPINDLLEQSTTAERLLATGEGAASPDSNAIATQLTSLQRSIDLFDLAIQAAVEQLLRDFSLDDPPQTWELNRSAWAWLRSPLPTSTQRDQLLRAIRSARPAPAVTGPGDIKLSDVHFASPAPAGEIERLVLGYREQLQDFERSALTNQASWKELLTASNGANVNFAERFAASLRVDPRNDFTQVSRQMVLHPITAAPIVRDPSLVMTDGNGNELASGDEIRLDSIEDTAKLNLQLDPDDPQPTRFLIRCLVRSTSASFRDPPVSVRWAIPGIQSGRIDEPIEINVASEGERTLPLELSPTNIAEPGETLTLEIKIESARPSERLQEITGTRSIRIALPQPNRLRVVASGHQIGCSQEEVSGAGSLPSGIWLRTFNDRDTPFRLEIFNESGKACRAKIWLVRLFNPMPELNGYWPDFAESKYARPEGGILLDGRVQDKYLRRNDRVLKGPHILEIPANQARVPVQFADNTDGEEAATQGSDSSSEDLPDVTHGMGLICRLLDSDGNPLPEDDQFIFLIPKPWEPKDYVTAEVRYVDGKVIVDAEVSETIDGDQRPDEIPELERKPIQIRWLEDDQWSSFEPESRDPPDSQTIRRRQVGVGLGTLRVEVPRRRNETRVGLEVDGWPRAIQQVVKHQDGAVGELEFSNQIGFQSVELTREQAGDETKRDIYFAPESDVFFKGKGEALLVTLGIDVSQRDWKMGRQPEIRVQIGRQPPLRYKTQRSLRTLAKEISDDGVITLHSTVTDLRLRLPDGQQPNARIPVIASIVAQQQEVLSRSVTAVLDSVPPETISIRPRKNGPYFERQTVGFSIAASEARREAAGISKLVWGLDTKGDGEIDTKEDFEIFAPPVQTASAPTARTDFEFQVAGNYGVVVHAIDAAGNESSRRYPVQVRKRQSNAMAAGGQKAAKPKLGRLHGKMAYSGFRGTLKLSPAPEPVNRQTVEIGGTKLGFDFGPLPEGEYSLQFDGTFNGRTRELKWSGLQIDTTPGKTRELLLRIDEAD